LATKTGERRLARGTETPELLAKYLAHIGQGELLTHEEEARGDSEMEVLAPLR